MQTTLRGTESCCEVRLAATMVPASGLDPRKERKARRNSMFSPTDLHAGVVQGENSVRGFEENDKKRKETAMRFLSMAPVEGLEPPTLRLTAACSTG